MPNPRARIRIVGRTFDLSLPLGIGRPVQTAGGAVYEEQGRPQDVAVTIYVGDSLIKMDVPILLDTHRTTQVDQTSRVEQLQALAQGREGTPPPNFRVSGPFPNSGMRAQFEAPELSEEPESIALPDGTLVRQAMVLKLIEFQDPTDLTFKRRDQHARGSSENPARGVALVTEVLRQGENLQQVSARIFGTPDRAKAIGELNKIHDLRKKLDRGLRLRLPAPTADLNR